MINPAAANLFANGNIKNLTRNALDGTTYDDFTYNYIAGTNKLEYVSDIASAGANTTDIDNQSAGNYDYDEIGNLIKDVSEEINNIEWTVYGKVKKVTRSSGSIKSDLEFSYDANGNRIIKIEKPRTGGNATNEDEWTYTYYSRDASGNTMAVYEETFSLISGNDYQRTIELIERPIYGSSRLGNIKSDLIVKQEKITITGFNSEGKFVYSTSQPTQNTIFNQVALLAVGGLKTPTVVNRTLGNKIYEHSNHLGNVLTTVSDMKIVFETTPSSGIIGSYSADQLSFVDYYPFGWVLPGRNGGSHYRYSFQSQEQDNEVYGSKGTYLNYTYRGHNTRLGRFFAVDPLAAKYPHNSTYAFSENRVIDAIELEGLEAVVILHIFDSKSNSLIIKKVPYTQIAKDKDFNGKLGMGNLHLYAHVDKDGKITWLDKKGVYEPLYTLSWDEINKRVDDRTEFVNKPIIKTDEPGAATEDSEIMGGNTNPVSSDEASGTGNFFESFAEKFKEFFNSNEVSKDNVQDGDTVNIIHHENTNREYIAPAKVNKNKEGKIEYENIESSDKTKEKPILR